MPSDRDPDQKQGGREARWLAGRRRRGKEGGRKEESKPAAKDSQRKVEEMVDRGTIGKGRGRTAALGVQNPAVCDLDSAMEACDWPHLAMVAGAAATEVHYICVYVAEHWGVGG